jgi:hypothetical protein
LLVHISSLIFKICGAADGGLSGHTRWHISAEKRPDAWICFQPTTFFRQIEGAIMDFRQQKPFPTGPLKPVGTNNFNYTAF